MAEIPKRLMNKWKLQKEHGDVKAIHEETVKAVADGSAQKAISEVTISNALRTGRASKETMKAISAFYTNKPSLKKKKQSELIKELDGE